MVYRVLKVLCVVDSAADADDETRDIEDAEIVDISESQSEVCKKLYLKLSFNILSNLKQV